MRKRFIRLVSALCESYGNSGRLQPLQSEAKDEGEGEEEHKLMNEFRKMIMRAKGHYE